VLDDGSVGPATCVVQHTGGSGVDAERQAGPHAHSLTLTPDDRFALVCDLGLDQVLVYRVDHANGRLEPNDPPFAATPPGAGPRHLDIHPNGRVVYVINELASTIGVYVFDPERGALTEQQIISTLPDGSSGATTTADVHVSPDGRYVYGSNRGHDSLAIFAVDDDRGRLTARGHVETYGRTPRNFAFDPDGTVVYVANQDTDTIVSFAYDAASGALTPTGQVVATLSPVCLKFWSPTA
jgi:6-phosphogluconolactonase